MKHISQYFYLIALLLILPALSAGCNEDGSPAIKTNITALESLTSVLSKAIADYSSDSKLISIYGRSVATDGTIDLSKPLSNIFLYAVQSETKKAVEFYVPVFAAGPVRSPLNLNDLTSIIKDTTAKNTILKGFQYLSGVTIDPKDILRDSPYAVDKAAKSTVGAQHLVQNPNARIDMYLVPSVKIDWTGVSNSADWIVTFSGDPTSLTQLVNSQTGITVVISQ